MSGYDHTQSGVVHWLLRVLALVLVGAGGATWGHDQGAVILLVVGGIFALTSFAFAHLQVHDAGQALRIQFGPLRVFRRSVPYAEIQSATPGRSRLIDGWGIHWIPGRGWTWNLHGFECVELTLRDGRRLRIGTDDSAGLAGFLATRIGD